MVNGKIKMTELEGGYKYPIIKGKSAYLSGKAGIGFAYTTVKANAGYKFGWELGRSGSTCRDGWNSPSQGKGSCSHHGGVAETHEEKIGKVRGTTFGIGLKYLLD